MIMMMIIIIIIISHYHNLIYYYTKMTCVTCVTMRGVLMWFRLVVVYSW